MNLNDLRVKLRSISFNAFNKILTFLINWKKKHKILSFIICIWLVVKIVCFPLYVYRYFKYGHFEEVGSITAKFVHPTLYEANYYIQYDHDTYIKQGDLLFYVAASYMPQANRYINEAFKKTDNYLTYNYSQEYLIYDYAYDMILYNKAPHGFLYRFNPKQKEFILLPPSKKFKNINIDPLLRLWSNDKEPPIYIGKNKGDFQDRNDSIIWSENYENKYFLQIGKGKNKKQVLPDVSFPFYITKINDNNIALIPTSGLFIDYENYRRFSIKENKIYKLDTTEIPREHGETIFLHLKDNQFIYIQREIDFGGLKSIKFYELINDKFIKKDIPLPWNYRWLSFSINNPILIDEDKILFIGGTKGYYTIGGPTKKCYIYDIKKAKIKRINDFPMRIEQVKFLKTTSGELYIYFDDEGLVYHNDEEYSKFRIYKYSKNIKEQ